MITEEERGLFIDWDLSKDCDDLDSVSPAGRTVRVKFLHSFNGDFMSLNCRVHDNSWQRASSFPDPRDLLCQSWVSNRRRDPDLDRDDDLESF